MQASDIPQDSQDAQGGKMQIRPFSFWFSYAQSKGKLSKEDYESGIKVLGSFSTVEDFWSYYQHMIRPDKLPVGCKFALFQEGIKPAWEDKANENGGSFIMRVKRAYSSKIWEDLQISYIGEQCKENDNICGLYLNIKPNEANISIWTKSIDQTQREVIGDWIKETLGLGDKIEVEYRPHPKHEEAQPAKGQGLKRFDRGDDMKRNEIKS